MDEILDAMIGLDKKNEIFNLWYEVTFLRIVLNHIVASNTSLAECLSEGIMDGCKAAAQQVVKERFPLAQIDFSEPSPEQMEKKKKHTENLHVLNKLMGAFIPNEHQTEDLACTPHTPESEPCASQAPSTEP